MEYCGKLEESYIFQANKTKLSTERIELGMGGGLLNNG
jgi:hypothetical protein